MLPPRAILFDLFHTLTSVELSGAPGRMTHELLGVSRRDWSDQLGKNADTLTLGREHDPLEAFAAMARAIDPHLPPARIAQAFDERRLRFGHAVTHPLPEDVRALRRLRALGPRLALVSNAWHDEIHTWNDSPLAQCLDVTVFSCQVDMKKPDPRIYQLAAERLGVPWNECWFVGDGASDELRGARAAGMTPVLLTHHLDAINPGLARERRPLARHCVARVDELPALWT